MNPKIEKVFLFVWYAAICMVVGALFNTGIAFASLWYPEVSLITATLTGYGLFSLVRRGK